jgi:iron complex outermembrane receptor protein
VPPAPDGNASFTNIGEIVVTAQKRKEKVQDVPVAVSVVNEEQLRNQDITQVDQLSRAIPSIEQNGLPGNPETETGIRGITTVTFSPTAEQAVSYVSDGVVLGKAPTVNLFDVSRVEVLRGPQGTLFGKNSSAGVINVTTNEPDPHKFELIAHADYGFEYAKHTAQAVVNVPVAEHAAFRLSLGQTREDGLINNLVQHDRSESWVDGGRLRFEWQPTSDLTLNLIGDYEKSDVNDQVYLLYSVFDNAKTGQPEPIPGCGGAYASYNARVACNNDTSFAKQGSEGLSAEINWTINDYLTLTSITAGRRYTQNSPVDPDGLPQTYYTNGNTYDNKSFSQELRVATPSGSTLESTAGVYFAKSNVLNGYSQNEYGDLILNVLLAQDANDNSYSPCENSGICLGTAAGLSQPNSYYVYLNSVAVFGQTTWHVTDGLRLIAGARLTRDITDLTSISYLGVTSSLAPILDQLLPSEASLFNSAIGPVNTPVIQIYHPLFAGDTVKNFSWKTGLQYDFNKHLMGYATVQRGYKGPQVVFNAVDLFSVGGIEKGPSTTVVNPEYPMDYEAGLKYTLLHGLFAADFNLFHTNIQGFQSYNQTLQGAQADNIPHVITEGAELDLLGFVAPDVILNGGAIFDRATYPAGYMTLCYQIGPRCPSTTNTLENVGGTQIQAAPRFKFTLTTGYQRDLGERISAFALTDVVYKTNIHYAAYTDTDGDTGCHFVTGVRIGLRDPDQRWSVALFGRNIFGAYNPAFLYAPYLASNYFAPGVRAVGVGVSDESFRFYGVSFDARF